ncbi:hypothetical protein L1887_14051 [Cichorium endivia]|nr:hypothetical protein L1887_14051 [Cichorium endivia]
MRSQLKENFIVTSTSHASALVLCHHSHFSDLVSLESECPTVPSPTAAITINSGAFTSEKLLHKTSFNLFGLTQQLHCRLLLSFKRGRNKMAYRDVQMFMDKLKQLIYCNDIPVNNDPSILREGPQFQLLYEELDSMIHNLFIHKDQDQQHFEEVSKLKKRFKAAAEEAEDIVDIFLSAVHFRNNGYFLGSDVFHPSLHLEVVMRSMKSIKMEFMTLRFDNMTMDLSQRTDRLQMQSGGTSGTRNLFGSQKLLKEVVVGLDGDVEIIRDKLVEDGKQLDVV